MLTTTEQKLVGLMHLILSLIHTQCFYIRFNTLTQIVEHFFLPHVFMLHRGTEWPHCGWFVKKKWKKWCCHRTMVLLWFFYLWARAGHVLKYWSDSSNVFSDEAVFPLNKVKVNGWHKSTLCLFLDLFELIYSEESKTLFYLLQQQQQEKKNSTRLCELLSSSPLVMACKTFSTCGFLKYLSYNFTSTIYLQSLWVNRPLHLINSLSALVAS